MNYKTILDNIINFLKENNEYIKIKYSRETDIQYAFIKDEIHNGKSPISLQKTLVSFYRIRLPEQHTRELLIIIENNKDEIKNTENIMLLYKKYYKEFYNITNRNEISFTSKLLNLYNKNIPLYDSQITRYLLTMGFYEDETPLKKYEALLNLYKYLFENNYFVNEIKNIKEQIYYKKEIKYVDEYKIFDTLMYSIGDINEFKKIKKIIK